MKTAASLASIRWKKFTEQFGLWLAQVVIFVFRAVFRLSELFASPKRKQRLRRLREEMDSIEQDKQQLIGQIKSGDLRGGLEAIDALQVRYAHPEEREEVQKSLSPLRKMRQESDALQAIARQAGDNKNLAVEGYRDYVRENPDSSIGYSYLGGFLKQTGDTNSSITAFQKSLQLADNDTFRSSMAHLHLGEAYLASGNTPAAIDEFQHIIDHAAPRTGPTVCLAYLSLGDAHLQAGDKLQAKNSWKKAIQWDISKVIAKKAQEKIKTL